MPVPEADSLRRNEAWHEEDRKTRNPIPKLNRVPMADTLRGSMDAAEYKHAVLGLIFLKYISDAFEERYARLEGERAQGADPEDPDEYRAENIFWVLPEARWAQLKAQAKQPTIGQRVDEAMVGAERDNPALKDVLPKDYARPALDKQRLGQLIDRISNIKVGDEAARSKDVLGRDYFLSRSGSERLPLLSLLIPRFRMNSASERPQDELRVLGPHRLGAHPGHSPGF